MGRLTTMTATRSCFAGVVQQLCGFLIEKGEMGIGFKCVHCRKWSDVGVSINQGTQ